MRGASHNVTLRRQMPDRYAAARTLYDASLEFWGDRTHASHRHSSEEWFERYALEILAMLPLGGALLDVGCGACELTTYLAPHFDHVVAIDFSGGMLNAARRRITANGLRNVTLIQAEAASLPLIARRFDAILAFSVLQYMDEVSLGRHMDECARVLLPHGVVCWGQVPNARLKWPFRLGLLSGRSIGPVQLVRRAWELWRQGRDAGRRRKPLADGIGRWIAPTEIESLAEKAGMVAEFRNNWYYEYRFHALLRWQQGVCR
jgi:ubiquinone/menaquinone biosynthesis C-methylase UbiE